MTVEQMRGHVMQFYPGYWPNRVLRMSDEQVIAIYNKFKDEKREPIKETKPDYTQLTLNGLKADIVIIDEGSF